MGIFCSERRMEDSERTVLDCLRGRLLAERAASRNAQQEAHQLGNKLVELETLLKQEAKSRKRAEKKLKSLMKKLESINIPYASDESAAFMDKSDFSSVSSTSSSTPKFHLQNHTTKIPNQESKQNMISQKALSSLSDDSFAAEDISISAFEIQLKRQEHEMRRSEDASSLEIFGRKTARNFAIEDSLSSGSDQHCDKSIDQQSDIIWYDGSIIKSSNEENDQSLDSHIEESLDSHHIEENDQSLDSHVEENDQSLDSHIEENDQSHVDDSMALVLVDTTTKKNRAIDPEILDQTVKQVLNALRYAKEQMERRRRTSMIRVG